MVVTAMVNFQRTFRRTDDLSHREYLPADGYGAGSGCTGIIGFNAVCHSPVALDLRKWAFNDQPISIAYRLPFAVRGSCGYIDGFTGLSLCGRESVACPADGNGGKINCKVINLYILSLRFGRLRKTEQHRIKIII